MPRLTRFFIKTALIYLVFALLLGLLNALPAAMAVLPRGVGPVFIHLLVVGWLTQLIFGVAYWMFPRFSRQYPRGSEPLMWASYALLNSGLALRLITEPALANDSSAAWGWFLAASALLQWLGGLAFVFNIWPRLQEK
jgi:hypothetical protein